MKNQIYIAVVGILLIVSFSLLLLYYTQDFKEEISFVGSINYADIEIQTQNKNYNQNINQDLVSIEPSYLSYASAELGTIKLENNGYFTQKYTFPTFVGCINFKESVGQDPIKFNIETGPEYSSYSSGVYKEIYPTQANQINIKVGDKIENKLVGVYNGNYNRIMLSTFSLENIKNIEIYMIPTKETNPLNDVGMRNYNIYYNDLCKQLENELEPIKVISIM